jgi:hypothetical protein
MPVGCWPFAQESAAEVTCQITWIDPKASEEFCVREFCGAQRRDLSRSAT